MRVLVLGAYGMLGHRLMWGLGEGFEVRGTCRQLRADVPESLVQPNNLIDGVDANDLSAVKEAIRSCRAEAVINCIGIIKQSPLAKDPVATIAINSLFPHQLAALCQDEGVRVVHFSTDCVFSGKKGGYSLEDPSDADDLYGRSKYLGEPSGRGVVTLRSSIIGRELGTHSGLVEWFVSQQGKKVKGFQEAYFTGFTTREMSEVVRTVLRCADAQGLWQVASKKISKFELLELINAELELGIEIVPDHTVHCDRSLDGSAFLRDFKYRPPTWKNMVKSMAEEWHLYDRVNGE
ncbi:MAG: SDR family oxidoreductase [Methanomassiliicoccales archaeon]